MQIHNMRLVPEPRFALVLNRAVPGGRSLDFWRRSSPTLSAFCAFAAVVFAVFLPSYFFRRARTAPPVIRWRHATAGADYRAADS